MPVVGAPDIERALDTTHAALALIMFVVPGIVALVCEPVLFLLADRHPRHRFIRGGVGAMAVGAGLVAIAPGPILFAIGTSIGAVATGTATGLAQATLVDRSPDERGKTLARWTLWSLAGDMVAPALLAGLALAGAGWRVAFAIVAVLLAVVCVVLCAAPLAAVARATPAPPTDEPADVPTEDADAASNDATVPAAPGGLLTQLREALSDRLLIAWLFGCALCDLLDEILVVFASIHLRTTLGAGPLVQAAVVAGFMVGAALGLVAVERLLRTRSERSLLVAASLLTVATFVPWVLSPSVLVALVLAVPVGFASGPLYPLAAAQAYARRPQQSGSVLAAAHLFTPLGLALPWLVGVVADRAGTTVALALLVAQPLGLVLLATSGRRRA